MSSGHWVGYIGNFQVNYDTLITMWAAMAFIIVCAFLLTRKIQIIPTKGQAIAEKIMDFFLDALKGIKNGEKQEELPEVKVEVKEEVKEEKTLPEYNIPTININIEQKTF